MSRASSSKADRWRGRPAFPLPGAGDTVRMIDEGSAKGDGDGG